MLGTRPDLGYAIAALGRHAVNPGPDHQHTLECMFCYLQATSNHQLVLGCGSSGDSTLLGYADADWASNVNDRKSALGYVFKLRSGAIS
jgi:histone deacetylase 1/2